MDRRFRPSSNVFWAPDLPESPMKFLLYAVLIFLVYRYFARLGRLEDKIDRLSDPPKPPVDQDRNADQDDYTDYEEIR